MWPSSTKLWLHSRLLGRPSWPWQRWAPVQPHARRLTAHTTSIRILWCIKISFFLNSNPEPRGKWKLWMEHNTAMKLDPVGAHFSMTKEHRSKYQTIMCATWLSCLIPLWWKIVFLHWRNYSIFITLLVATFSKKISTGKKIPRNKKRILLTCLKMLIRKSSSGN